MKSLHLRKNWRKVILIAVGIFLLGIPVGFLMYCALLVGRYTKGMKIKISVSKKKVEETLQ